MSPVVPASRQELQKKKINTRFLLLKLGKFPWEEQARFGPAPSLRVPVPAGLVQPLRPAAARDVQSFPRQQKLSGCLISLCLISLRDSQVIEKWKRAQDSLTPIPGDGGGWGSRGCQHSGVPSCVGQSPFSPTPIFLTCSGVNKTSLGSILGARVSTGVSGSLPASGGAGGGAVGPGGGRAAPAPRLSPRQEINN